jgi:hypothetical protein
VDGRREPEVEVREVDGDQNVGPVAAGAFDQAPDHRERARHHADRFRQSVTATRDSRLQLRASLAQAVAAEPDDMALRVAGAKCGHQRAGVGSPDARRRKS